MQLVHFILYHVTSNEWSRVSIFNEYKQRRKRYIESERKCNLPGSRLYIYSIAVILNKMFKFPELPLTLYTKYKFIEPQTYIYPFPLFITLTFNTYYKIYMKHVMMICFLLFIFYFFH